MVTSDVDNMITLLATLGVDAAPMERSAELRIDRFAQWVDDQSPNSKSCVNCFTIAFPAEQLV
ncbi:hypothetical protein SAMN05192558_11841 [Actinokineospora alba]|uniref:Uncharacterized protein n=1 Tax=Actinokineospora alba TaxID=504798 RepID=A0A1H0W762_9PSEU|nr:hypothetical protein [Actinokineospora alba]TDP70013.1 hypothetical protein C8E96_5613 [Actinokineospora alba]SDJ49905.1 hypothetical protein SAMN05421871_11741 [Actinokineospora alba]SDP86458.1 hypothetical protein SAMN05192558_11841 [Actinokineospora alba]